MFSIQFNHGQNEEFMNYTKDHKLKQILDSKLNAYELPDMIVNNEKNQIISIQCHNKISKYILKDSASAAAEFFKSFMDLNDEFIEFAKDQFVKRIDQLEYSHDAYGNFTGKLIFVEGEVIRSVYIKFSFHKIKKFFKTKKIKKIEIQILDFSFNNAYSEIGYKFSKHAYK